MNMNVNSVDSLVTQIQGLSGSPQDVSHLNTLLKQSEDVIRSQAATFAPCLTRLDPALHSLGYLYVLEACTATPVPEAQANELILPVVRFIDVCSVEQIRLVPDKFISVCKRLHELVMTIKTPMRAVGPLLTAIHKIRSSPEHLTPLHPDFLQVCLLAKCYKIGYSVLEDDIYEVDQPRDFFLYCYYGGMICIGQKRFAKALELFHNVVTAPMSSMNAIAVEAYKKYILVSLIHLRQFSATFPKYTSSVAQRNLKNFSQPYIELANSYSTGNISELKAFVQENQEKFENSHGADVNQKLFRGFSITAAVREGHYEISEILLKNGASQSACEEALLEASCHGRGGKFIELLMASDLIRANIAVRALVTACCRGFTDVVDTLLKCGVDVNAAARVLLQSSKPSLHTNIDCTALVAAVVSRQVAVVHLLLQNGAKTDIKVPLGAWSWDMGSGDEFRVGAGLAEPYAITWCAVEYFESSGTILQLLLRHLSPNTYHNGRTLLHHAVLCGNIGAVKTLLKCGSHIESRIKTTHKPESQAVHMASRLGFPSILQHLIDSSCDINSRITYSDETPLMICAKFKQKESLRVLIKAGADLGLVNMFGQSAWSIAESNKWSNSFRQTVLNVIKDGMIPVSNNNTIFSPLIFVASSGDIQALKAIVSRENINVNEQDSNGLSAVMVTAMQGDVQAFKLLVYSGADVKLTNKKGESAISLSKTKYNSDMFEEVMLRFTLEKGNKSSQGFYPLHYASRHGDTQAVKLLTTRGYDINALNGDGYTPLMLAAREGNAQMCKLLISCGALCDVSNSKGESALTLARKHTMKHAECVILDECARVLVLGGGNVLKHTRGGKGRPHRKMLKMIGSEGVLRWGNSKRRNVVCLEAEVGPSPKFVKRRMAKGDTNTSGVFRVVTVKKKEVHFVCEGGYEMAELWVRGIRLVTIEALSGRLKSRVL